MVSLGLQRKCMIDSEDRANRLTGRNATDPKKNDIEHSSCENQTKKNDFVSHYIHILQQHQQKQNHSKYNSAITEKEHDPSIDLDEDSTSTAETFEVDEVDEEEDFFLFQGSESRTQSSENIIDSSALKFSNVSLSHPEHFSIDDDEEEDTDQKIDKNQYETTTTTTNYSNSNNMQLSSLKEEIEVSTKVSCDTFVPQHEEEEEFLEDNEEMIVFYHESEEGNFLKTSSPPLFLQSDESQGVNFPLVNIDLDSNYASTIRDMASSQQRHPIDILKEIRNEYIKKMTEEEATRKKRDVNVVDATATSKAETAAKSQKCTQEIISEFEEFMINFYSNGSGIY